MQNTDTMSNNTIPANQAYSTTKSSSEKINNVLLSLQLYADSFGLKPFKIILIESEVAKARIQLPKKYSSKLPANSRFLIFATYTAFDKHQVYNYIDSIAKQKKTSSSSLNEYRKFLAENINKTDKEGRNWSERQAGIAVDKLLEAASDSSLKAVVIKDFNRERIDEIPQLSGQGLKSFAIVALFDEQHSNSLVKLPAKESLHEVYQFA